MRHSCVSSASPLPPSTVFLGLKGDPQLLDLVGETVPLYFRGVGLGLGTLTAVFLEIYDRQLSLEAIGSTCSTPIKGSGGLSNPHK